MKKQFCFFPVMLAVFITGCDLFQTSLTDYLRELPADLRLNSLWAEHNSQIFYPLEAPEPGRDTWTIVVTPAKSAGIGIALHADVQASSNAAVPAPWLMPARSIPVVEGIQNYWKYRDNEEKQIVVTSANGVSKIHTVTIIWAKLIDDPDEIRKDLSQDYYLKPGPPIDLSPGLLPIGAAAAYSSYTVFSGSLRGNGRTIRIHSFETPSGHAAAQGLFGKIQWAWIEDLHVQLAGTVSTKAKNAGGLAGTATGSIIQRVKVSGGISNSYRGSETNVGGITGSLGDKAIIRNSVSMADVSGSFSFSVSGSGNAYEHFYMGGITGNQVYTSGGYIFNAFAGGKVTASTPATVGGITGGGGYSPNHIAANSNIKGCAAVNPDIDAGKGSADYILGQWDGPATGTVDINSQNYRQENISLSGNVHPVPADQRITGVSKTEADLKQQSTYAGLGWDFNAAWKMGSSGYPALMWE
jgi:hypothetical protein